MYVAMYEKGQGWFVYDTRTCVTYEVSKPRTRAKAERRCKELNDANNSSSL